MKNFQKYLNQNIIFSFLIAIVITGCSKVGEGVNTDETVVNINLLGAESNAEDDLQGKLAKQGSSSLNNNIQTTVIPFDDNFTLVATLSPEGTTKETNSQQINTANSSGARAATGPVRTNLAANVRYKVLVYNAAGALLQQKDYSYGNEATIGGFTLDGETSYTFIAYSVNSTSTLPAVVSPNSLTTVNVANVTGDLMYFKETIKLKKGINNLNVLLKHQFSQITTTVSLDPSSTGTVTAISAPVLKPTRTSASINLNTGALTYSSVNTAGIPLVFGALNVRSVAATPVQIITPAITNGTFDIGAITMNGLTKGPISIPNLRINPGCKYNLNLAFVAPCTQIVNTGDFAFNVSNGATKTFSAPAADFGFSFDLLEVDNSFNLRINNVDLMNQETEFQSNTAGSPNGQSVQFADGSYWGNGSVPEIYNMKGTTGKPIIRVTIDGNGKVAMFGSKSAGGPLFPLVLRGTAAFNTITWNKTGSNTVVASQSVRGATYLIGEGYGKKVITCPQ